MIFVADVVYQVLRAWLWGICIFR